MRLSKEVLRRVQGEPLIYLNAKRKSQCIFRLVSFSAETNQVKHTQENQEWQNLFFQ
jgi:hypothetical protein